MSQQSRSPVLRGGAGSYAAVNGHPLHPVLVPIAIGMYVAAACADIGSVATGDPFWARSTNWLLLGTLAAAAIAAIPGIIDFMSIDRAQNLSVGWAHVAGNSLFLMITAGNYGLRQADPAAAHGWSGLLVSLVGLVVLFVSGWLGGEMSFRHGIGVPQGVDETEAAPPRAK